MAIVRLHYSADEERWTPEAVAKLRGTYTSEARWNREMEVQADALEGQLLLPEFHRDRNLCAPFDVSDRDRWTIYMALDPHPRTAHAMAWRAWNKHGDSVVCGEFWPEFGTTYGPTDGIRWHTREYAEWIQFFESDSEQKPEPFRWARGKRLYVYRRFMDTFGAATNSDEGEDYFETYRKLGHKLSQPAELLKRVSDIGATEASLLLNLNFTPALKGHDNLAKAYDSVSRALMPQQDASGKQFPPLLTIFDNCEECIDEAENVRFPEGEPEKAVDERPITYRKHVLDCIFYMETSRPRFILPHRKIAAPETRGGDGVSY
jgi:hypothetical protein